MKIISENYPNFEAKQKVWDKFEAEIIIEIHEDIEFSDEDKAQYFQKIDEKIKWIEENRDLILNSFLEEEGMFAGLNEEINLKITKNKIATFYNGLSFERELTEEEFKEAIGVRYLNFYIDKEQIHCDFDLGAEPDYFFGHLANIELDEENHIEMGGVNG